MTSLSSLTTSISSPRTQMNTRIGAAVSAGSISKTDQTALSTALDSIDKTLAGSKPGARASMKDKIDSLVDDQVKAGTLTDDQAAELKQFFTQGAPQSGASADESDGTSDGVTAAGGAKGPGGPGGMRGAGGPPPGPPPASDDDADGDDSSSTDATYTATTGNAVDQRLAAMEKFLEKLRESLDAGGTYGSSKTTTSSSTTGLVYNAVA